MANAIDSLNYGNNTYTFTLPYGSCSTAAATAAKAVTVSNFSLETGARIAVKFTVTNTASSPTLNVNGSGAKAIYYKGAAITAGYLAANKTYEFVYNGTQWDLIGDVDTNTTYTFNGAVSTIKDSNLTASRALVSNSSGKVAVSAVTSTELGYLDGVTSNVQTQLDGKSSTSHTHNLSTMINTLSAGTSNPTDADYYVCQYAGGGTTTTTYHRRPMSALWNWIKSKADSVYQAKGSYASSSHTHNYAGSSSAGGAATSANKLNTNAGDSNTPVYFSNGVPVACTSLDLNTTGSAASCTGNSATATKMATARTITLSNDLQGSASFDGSGNISISASNYQASIASSDTNTYPYHRIAYVSNITGQWSDKDAIFEIRHTWNNGGYGRFKVSLRTNATGAAIQATANWLYRYNIASDAITIGTYGVTGNSCYADVFYKYSRTYARAEVIQVLGDRAWTLVSSTEAASAASHTECWASVSDAATALHSQAYTNTYTSVDGGTVNVANKLGTSTVGGAVKPIYLNAGVPTACSSTVGSATQPVYMNGGTITACTYTLGKSVPSNAVFTDTTYSAATTSAAGLMSASDKSKLNGIASGANAYSLPAATSSTLGGVKTGSNITNSSGTISLTKANVTAALGYTPPTTNTTYSAATTSAAGLMSASDKSKLDGIATGANKITVDSAMSSTSTNPVQNKVVRAALNKKPGRNVEGETLYDYDDVDYAGGAYAEIFNDYSCNVASGDFSHAEGGQVYAEGDYSHAEGYNTHANGDYSHAEGYNTYANGSCCHAEGYNTSASGYYSHAEGYYSIANYYQHASGKYNAITTAPSGYNSQDSTQADGIFIVGSGTSSARKNVFRISSGGKCYGTAAFGASGADFAELFEWADGNPDSEDRRGLFVTLDGEKIKLANAGDDYIGVISSAQAFVGNSASEDWQGKYLTDVFGAKLSQEVEVPAEIDEETGEVLTPATTATQYVLNPDYDPDQEYVMRENRKEWGIVGLLGQIVVVDDGTCVVGGHIEPSTNGIGTSSTSGYRVMARIDENHVKILVK